jgi:hypothetical protein
MSPTPPPYHYSTSQCLEQCSPMLFPVTNTNYSCSTDANFQLLSSAHAQEGLAWVAHKRRSPSETGSYSLQTAAAFAGPYRFGNPLQFSDTQKDAGGEIRTASPDAPKDSECLDVLANGLLSPLSKNDMAFRDGNMNLRPSALSGAFQPTLDDNIPGTSPAQAAGVQQPTQEVHANALLQPTPDHSGSPPAADSTNSDGNGGSFVKRPHSRSSDLDTYSCTYHGCTQRFEATLDLKRHKQRVHRQTDAGQDEEASVPSVAAQKSQAGPHKCKRINPSTGKPCNRPSHDRMI